MNERDPNRLLAEQARRKRGELAPLGDLLQQPENRHAR